MKKMSKRAILCLIMALLLVSGMIFFTIQYIANGGDWASSSANGNVFSDGVLTKGTVTDRNGVVLFHADNEYYSYADDYTVRVATLHSLGDISGNISTGVLSNYKKELINYNPIFGVNSDKEGTVTLNLDSDVCAYAYNLLDGRKGTIGVYNYKTGEIICDVSTPAYDPEYPISTEEAESDYYSGVYLNKLLSGEYTPGSIMKIVTAYAAIENIDDIYDRTFTCDGTMDINGEEIVCEGTHGEISFEEALSVSCNCAFAQISQLLDAETLSEYIENAGLTQSYTVGKNETAKGSYQLKNVTECDKAWTAIGQHKDLINPCSYMVFLGAIANDGVAVSPTLVSTDNSSSHRIMSQETAQKLQQMLIRNVEMQYTGYYFGDNTVGAKSGSAEVGTDYTNAMFTGFILDENYPYAFIIAVENAGSGYSVGGYIASNLITYIESK